MLRMGRSLCAGAQRRAVVGGSRRLQSTLTRARAPCGRTAAALVAGAAAAGAAGTLLLEKPTLPAPPVSRAEAAAGSQPELGKMLLEKASAHIPGIEEYTRAQVAEHASPDSAWVTYGSAVYDITEFVKQHPGGAKRIMLAAGKDLAPFWRIYQQHFGEGASETVATHLARMRIGNLVPGDDDDDVASDTGDDPFAAEPSGRHPSLKVWSQRAFNAESPADLIGDTWITPNEVFYCRHHHPVPNIDPEEYRLSVKGLGVERELSLTLDNLKTLFPKREIVVTTQCGGNRRSGMNKVKKTMGISWGVGAISTAKWGGVWLRDVLRLAGLDDEERAAEVGVKQVHFECADKPFGVSIGRRKALGHRGDVLLAYEMNGEPLAREHGAPVRVVVPGYLGVRSAKWVDSIVAAAEPIETEWQTGFSYRAFPPNLTEQPEDLSPYPPVQELPVQSAMLLPADGDSVSADAYTTWGLDLKGYAWAGGGRKIVRVDVSADGGKTWEQAELTSGAEQPSERAWAWVLWEATIDAPVLQRLAAQAATSEQPALDNGDKGAAGRWLSLTCKATDESFNTQPESPASIWNLRGILNNSWHTIHVKLPKCNHPDCNGVGCTRMPLEDEQASIRASRCIEKCDQARATAIQLDALSTVPGVGGGATLAEYEKVADLFIEAARLYNPTVLQQRGLTKAEIERYEAQAVEAVNAVKAAAQKRELEKRKEKAARVATTNSKIVGS